MQPASLKTNRVLLIICIAFLMIGVRVFHLGVVQREDMLKEADKPKLRTLLLRADRGEICDRFNIPLAENRICYNAAVYYSGINQIPTKGWKTDDSGERIRTYPRKEHIRQMSQVLGKELDLEPARIEDLIHAKASLLPHIPFILKTNLQEKEYYRLKMLEKDFPGIHAEIGSLRYYPQGKVGCHLIGTLGSISQKQYSSIAQEIHSLQEIITEVETLGEWALPHPYDSIEEVFQRLETLKDRAYTLVDKVGKTGVEGQFEEDLRGYWGVKTLEVDTQGKPVRELFPNGKKPIPGQKVVLSISSELQQFAEELLILNEKERDGKSFGIDPVDKTRKGQKQPWIKGGAIVALDPTTGEVLCFASHPRFDPNDFIGGGSKTFRWLENEKMIGSLWDGEKPLTRERPQGFTKKITEEQAFITWEFYLDQILSKDGDLRTFFEKVDDIKGFIQIQEDFQSLLYFSKGISPELLMEAITTKTSSLWDKLKTFEDSAPSVRRLESVLAPIASVQDRLFAIDLCKLAVYSPCFSDELISKIGSMKISSYRLASQIFCNRARAKKEEEFQVFHTKQFPLWRECHQKEFLKKKRSLEKERKTYAKPYIDYLTAQEKELFSKHWEEKGISLLLNDPGAPLQKILESIPSALGEEFLRTFRSFEDFDRPLLMTHPKIKTEKDLAAAFYPVGNFGYGRSYAFQSGVPQGSLFKIVTAYEGLRQGQNFSLIDKHGQEGKNQIVAYSINQTPYFRLYKGGRLPRTFGSRVGKIDLIGAIEHSSNPYFSILAGDFFKNPEDLNEAAALFGYGQKTGIDLPGEVKGNLPSDLKTNRTGLYAYAIGQHTLLNTPLQSALMLATLANGGKLLKPQILKQTCPPEIKQTIWFPLSVRNCLFEGMDKCIWSSSGSARPSSIPTLLASPPLMHNYLLLQHQMIGKTSTAEILFNPGRYPSSLPQMYKHTWFGSIAFQDNAQTKTRWEYPELVVVIFLRFGSGGKEAAPLAAQVIHKWREIQAKHQSLSYFEPL